MTKWIVTVVILLSGLILWFMYNQLAEEKPMDASVPQPIVRKVHVYDAFKDNTHHLTGQVKLPHSCYLLDGTAELVTGKQESIKLKLSSKDKSQEWKNCLQIQTNYQFDMLMDAPQDIPVAIELDGKELPAIIIRTEWNSAKGSFVVPGN